jgi:3-oxoadipate enol-lactonase
MMVLIHALGADSQMWNDVAAALGNEVAIYAPDLYGIGDTPPHAHPPTVAEQADRLVPLVSAFNAPVVVIGCAIGSMIAAELAARLGTRALGLVMANPILRITEPAGDVLKARANRARQGGIEAIEDEVLGRSFEGIDPARKAAFRSRFLGMSGTGYADFAEGSCGADVGDALARVTCPILLVPGGLDQILPDWHPDEIRKIVPQADVVTVASGAHFMPQQAPEAFAQATRPFLQRVTAGRG